MVALDESLKRVSWHELERVIYSKDLSDKLVNFDANRDFFAATYSKDDYLNALDYYLTDILINVVKEKKYNDLEVIKTAIENIFKPIVLNDIYSFYKYHLLLSLLTSSYSKKKEFKFFEKFIEEIDFNEKHEKISEYFTKCVNNNLSINEATLVDMLNYINIYFKKTIPMKFVNYIFKNLLKKENIDKKYSLDSLVNLFKYFIYNVLESIESDFVVAVTNDEIATKEVFVNYEEKKFYLNKDKINVKPRNNVYIFGSIFFELEKLKLQIEKDPDTIDYEEYLNKKEEVIINELGESYFSKNFGYMSNDTNIRLKSIIDEMRYFKEVSIYLYDEYLAEMTKKINSALETVKTPDYSTIKYANLTVNDLMEKLVRSNPYIALRHPILSYEYHNNGIKKSILDLVIEYEHLIRKRDSKSVKEAKLIETIIFNSSLTPVEIIYQIIDLAKYDSDINEVQRLKMRILNDHMINEINRNIRHHIIDEENLDKILMILYNYLAKLYIKKKEILDKNIKSKTWIYQKEWLDELYRSIANICDKHNYNKTLMDITYIVPFDEIEKQAQIEKKKKNAKKQRNYIVSLIIAILVFILSIFFIVMIYIKYKKAEDEYKKLQNLVDVVEVEKEKPVEEPEEEEPIVVDTSVPKVDFNELWKVNKDIVGWIKIDNTPVDYPIVQSNDNEKYLYRTVQGTHNSAGSIFMDYRANAKFEFHNSVLYGHKMKNGTMFGTLYKYKTKSYYEENKYIWLVTRDVTYKYEVFSVYEFDSKEHFYEFNFEDETEYQNYLNYIKNASYYNTGLEVTTDDYILTLSTCTVNLDDTRLAVIAKRVETYRHL